MRSMIYRRMAAFAMAVTLLVSAPTATAEMLNDLTTAPGESVTVQDAASASESTTEIGENETEGKKNEDKADAALPTEETAVSSGEGVTASTEAQSSEDETKQPTGEAAAEESEDSSEQETASSGEETTETGETTTETGETNTETVETTPETEEESTEPEPVVTVTQVLNELDVLRVNWNDNLEKPSTDSESTNAADRPEASAFTSDIRLYYSLDGENYVLLTETDLVDYKINK